MWTKEQEQAIQADNQKIVVSASAGSGKTAVLVERVLEKVKHGYPLDRMLMITFTRAAAAEMRQRIVERLNDENRLTDDPKIHEAMNQIRYTQISTIHSFCSQIVRNYFQQVDVDPAFEIADSGLIRKIRHESFVRAFNEMDEKDPETKAALLAIFTVEKLESVILNFYDSVISVPAPKNWITERLNEIPVENIENHAWYDILMRKKKRKIARICKLINRIQDILYDNGSFDSYVKKIASELDDLSRILQTDDPKMIFEQLNAYKFSALPRSRVETDREEEWKAKITELRDSLKKSIADYKEDFFPEEETSERDMTRMRAQLKDLSTLLFAYMDVFLEEKKNRAVLEYSDLEQMTLEILSNPEFQKTISEKFDHIMVDECQDISSVQDRIIQCLKNDRNHLFMVGDVKQSIYRFRMAEPSIFLNRILSFEQDENAACRSIFLQNNFRSSATVIDGTNLVFERIMKRDIMDIEYDEKEHLKTGREDLPLSHIQIDVLKGEEKTEEEKTRRIAGHLQQAIRQKLKQEKNDKGETYRYRDMVILMPAVVDTGAQLAAMLQEYGVPVYFDGNENFGQQLEIMIMLDYFRLIDNPMQDIPLLMCLKNEPFCFTDTELIQIRNRHSEKKHFYEALMDESQQTDPMGERCRKTIETIDLWRLRSETMKLSEFAWFLSHETMAYQDAGMDRSGGLCQANLRILFDKIHSLEDHGICSVHEMIEHLTDTVSDDDMKSARLLGENEDLVRIMTIHKSKGLQFPVVFCVGTEKKMLHQDTRELRVDRNLGLAMPIYDREKHIRQTNLAMEVFRAEDERQERAERARLLYVAMTRAITELEFVALIREKDGEIPSEADGAASAEEAGSIFEWVWDTARTLQLSTNYTQEENPYQIRVYDSFEMLPVENSEVINKEEKVDFQPNPNLNVDNIRKLWKSREKKPVRDPLKSAVTSFIRQGKTVENILLEKEEETIQVKRNDLSHEAELAEWCPLPSFMTENQHSGTNIGTATHRVLSLLDLEELAGSQNEDLDQEIRVQIRRMLSLGILSDDEVRLARVSAIVRFFRSRTGHELLENHPTAKREWRFNLKISDRNYLQGVIDCIYRTDEGWVLIDYKTDRVSDAAVLLEHYAEQIRWYRYAFEQLTGEKILRAGLYALSLDQEIFLSET